MKSAIWDVAASNATASGAGSKAGWTPAVVGDANTSAAFGLLELNANAVKTKRKRALEAVLRDASGVSIDVASGSAFKS